MSPLTRHDQQVVAFDIQTKPRAEVSSVKDAFGNEHHVFDIRGSHQSLEITGNTIVEKVVTTPSVVESTVADWHTIRSWERSWEFWNFIEPSKKTIPSESFLLWLKGFHISEVDSPLQRLKRMEAYIHGSVAYQKNVTQVDTPITEVLRLKSGVCQDFSHLLLTASRLWGIPSRYVSGYLCNGSDQADTDNVPNETHAWVECYLPHGKWIALDPTNPTNTDDDRIVVAVGRDYGDVSPTRGVTFGKELVNSELFVEVTVGEETST